MKLLVLAIVVSLAATAAAFASERPPAVAGAFYPADPNLLRSQVEEMLAAARTEAGARAVVVPHAGYPYSGPVAAEAFASLDGKRVRRVILLGPSHHQGFRGAALPARGVSSFVTPLGSVAVDTDAVAALRRSREFSGPAEAHGPEHSLEVELPFLQVVAPDARIVPVLVGSDTEYEDTTHIARALAPLLDEETVVVASSDFTHHGARYGWTPFSEPDLGGKLLRLGSATAGRLAAIDSEGFWYQVEVSSDTVCGARPLTVLAQLLAHAFDGSGTVVDVTTSGQRTGSWDLSVTYAAIVFRGAWKPWVEDQTPAPVGELSAEQGSRIVALARAALRSYLLHDESVAEWFAAAGNASWFQHRAGAFVTLNNTGEKLRRDGRLRACMGVIEAQQPLDEAVLQAAVWAARDPRFPPLKPAELEEIEVEVSVLSAPHRVAGPQDIVVGRDGVVLSKGGRRAVFLPQVAAEQGWDRDTMLNHLARKAGLPTDSWRQGAQFEVFTAQVFAEGE